MKGVRGQPGGGRQSHKLLRKKPGKRHRNTGERQQEKRKSYENIQHYILFIQHSTTDDTTSEGNVKSLAPASGETSEGHMSERGTTGRKEEKGESLMSVVRSAARRQSAREDAHRERGRQS